MTESRPAEPIALLPMYDWPELRAATDALWRAIAGALRRRGIAAPEALARNLARDAAWTAPTLVVAQTCGLPYVSVLRPRVALLGAPDYTTGGGPPGTCRSLVVARADDPRRRLADFRGARAAYNEPGSQTGYAALLALVAPLAEGGRFFAAAVETGSHRRSIAAVAAGAADLAAVDSVCWALAGRYDGTATARLRVVAESPAVPGLPLITAGGRGADERAAIGDAVALAIDGLDREARGALCLGGFVPRAPADYDVIADAVQIAHRRGYPALA
jgi:ABC-type phosphate/phosphonate transport system substrate-binding protein